MFVCSIRDKVTEFLRVEFHSCQCHIFGSAANNLGFRDSDVDLYAELGFDPYEGLDKKAGEKNASDFVW